MRLNELENLQVTQEDLDNLNKSEGAVDVVYKIKRLTEINYSSRAIQSISIFGILTPWLLTACSASDIEVERLYLMLLISGFATMLFGYTFVKHFFITRKTNEILKHIEIVEK